MGLRAWQQGGFAMEKAPNSSLSFNSIHWLRLNLFLAPSLTEFSSKTTGHRVRNNPPDHSRNYTKACLCMLCTKFQGAPRRWIVATVGLRSRSHSFIGMTALLAAFVNKLFYLLKRTYMFPFFLLLVKQNILLLSLSQLEPILLFPSCCFPLFPATLGSPIPLYTVHNVV